MNITAYCYPILVLLLLLTPLYTYSKDAVEARKELAELRVPFTRDVFMNRVKESDPVVVQLFIESGMNVNVKDENGKTALIWAAELGYSGIVELLLAAGADVNTTHGVNESALTHAARNGHIAVATSLLKAGADKNAQISTLVELVKRNRTNMLQALLVAGVDKDIADEDGKTALIWAAERGHDAIVKILLNAGADVNVQDKEGWTALVSAAVYGHVGVVQTLLAAGADMNQAKEGIAALMMAAISGRGGVVQALLAAGADVNAQGKEGITALLVAAFYGHEAIVQVLLAAGADVHVQAKEGITALMAAAAQGHVTIVKILLDAGAGLQAKTKGGDTALMLAEKNKRTEVVRLIREVQGERPLETKKPPMDASQEIRQAQERLEAAGFNPGSIDGILGPQTEAALRRFQAEHGLPETGQLDEVTQKTLFEVKPQQPATDKQQAIMTSNKYIKLLRYKKSLCYYHTGREDSICVEVSYKAQQNLSIYDNHKIIIHCFDNKSTPIEGDSSGVPIGLDSLTAGEVRIANLRCPPGTTAFKLEAH